MCFMRVTDNLTWNPIFPHCSWQHLVAAAATGKLGTNREDERPDNRSQSGMRLQFPAAGTPLTPSPRSNSQKQCAHCTTKASALEWGILPCPLMCFFLHLPLTLSQFLRMSKRQGRTLHPNMRKCLIYTLARTKKQFECNINWQMITETHHRF